MKQQQIYRATMRQYKKQTMFAAMYSSSWRWPLNAERCELKYSLQLKRTEVMKMTIKTETREALAAMSVEDIVTTIQVAGTDELFMSALSKTQIDALIKQSIEHASAIQEKTDQWPAFEEWLAFRAGLIHAALKESPNVGATPVP